MYVDVAGSRARACDGRARPRRSLSTAGVPGLFTTSLHLRSLSFLLFRPLALQVQLLVQDLRAVSSSQVPVPSACSVAKRRLVMLSAGVCRCSCKPRTLVAVPPNLHHQIRMVAIAFDLRVFSLRIAS